MVRLPVELQLMVFDHVVVSRHALEWTLDEATLVFHKRDPQPPMGWKANNLHHLIGLTDSSVGRPLLEPIMKAYYRSNIFFIRPENLEQALHDYELYTSLDGDSTDGDSTDDDPAQKALAPFDLIGHIRIDVRAHDWEIEGGFVEGCKRSPSSFYCLFATPTARKQKCELEIRFSAPTHQTLMYLKAKFVFAYGKLVDAGYNVQVQCANHVDLYCPQDLSPFFVAPVKQQWSEWYRILEEYRQNVSVSEPAYRPDR
ncbi:hypothetical protein M011DRAFT_482202 [Sporormia fimetaria CBS 119925]|uniref:Uncharacterized protein n=1 Tax=Sporormia fimetaria CBS 119925 TaxID=1340428 RepID=A0A6A6UWL6_9PLEO|nr:hypothetical protein M011DRAFT_482202 [Sporormia fimetaria CBS 119925]